MSRAAYIPDVFDSGAFVLPQRSRRELFNNGDFSDGLSGWVVGYGVPVIQSGYLKGDGGNAKISQTVVGISGQYLKIECELGAYGSQRDYADIYVLWRNSANGYEQRVNVSAQYMESEAWTVLTVRKEIPEDVDEFDICIELVTESPQNSDGYVRYISGWFE